MIDMNAIVKDCLALSLQGDLSTETQPYLETVLGFSQQYYTQIDQKIMCVEQREGDSVLVFASTYGGKQLEGTVVTLTGLDRIEDEDPQQRIETMRAIYCLLQRSDEHARIVRFLGETRSGLRLEKLWPGPLPTSWPCLSAAESDLDRGTVIALHQRWALQLLSAIIHMHSNNIIINQLDLEMLWLREDYSIAIAIPYAAGCTNPRIRADSLWYPDWHIRSQWDLYSQWRLYTDGPRWLDDEKCSASQLAGDPKVDMFNWATLMYKIMFPDDHPIKQAMYQQAVYAAEPGRFQKEFKRRLHQINRGRNHTHFWPQLPDEMLGPVLKKCWLGKYANSKNALLDLQHTLAGLGVAFEGQDEIAGFTWHDLLNVEEQGTYDGTHALRLKTTTSRDVSNTT